MRRNFRIRVGLALAVAVAGSAAAWWYARIDERVVPRLVATAWDSSEFIVVREMSVGSGDWLLTCETLEENLKRGFESDIPADWVPTSPIYLWRIHTPLDLRQASTTEWQQATGSISDLGDRRLAGNRPSHWSGTGGKYIVATSRAVLNTGAAYTAVLSAEKRSEPFVGYHFGAGGATVSGPFYVDVFSCGGETRRGRRIRLAQSSAPWSATAVGWLDDHGTIVVWAPMKDANSLWIAPQSEWGGDDEETRR